MDKRFDDLAKALAGEQSRRQMLWRLGSGFAGAVLASLGLSKSASAANPDTGNDECAHFCTATFPPGPERGKCISDAAHGAGPCFACGGPKGPSPEACLCPNGGQTCGTFEPFCGSSGFNGVCACFQTTEGSGCLNDFPCLGSQACNTSADCPTGQSCAINTCCGAQGFCTGPCDNPGAQAQIGLNALSGPTASGR